MDQWREFHVLSFCQEVCDTHSRFELFTNQQLISTYIIFTPLLHYSAAYSYFLVYLLAGHTHPFVLGCYHYIRSLLVTKLRVIHNRLSSKLSLIR